METNRERLPSVPGASPGDVDSSTRQKVASSILELGPCTAAELASHLGLTPAAIRRHLDLLIANGHVEAREARVYGTRGRGRPAKAFVMTDAGRSIFYTAYDTLAVDALRFLAEGGGEQAVTAFAQARAATLEDRYREVVQLEGLAGSASPAQALAAALTEDGYVASAVPTPMGEQLCQHHCPVGRVAVAYPQLCEAETELFSRVLGVHVQRLATIAQGHGVCTTHIPTRPAVTAEPTSPQTSDATYASVGTSRNGASAAAPTRSTDPQEGP